MLTGYYRDRHVRARLHEYAGRAPGSCTTAAYAGTIDPAWRGPKARWETAMLGAPDDLDGMLERGGDIARSLWDREALLFHLDLDYQNTDAPGEPFAYPAEIFFRLEPIYRAVRREMLRFGLPLFVLMTGRGYHFTGRLRLDSRLVPAQRAAAGRGQRDGGRYGPHGTDCGITRFFPYGRSARRASHQNGVQRLPDACVAP